MNVPVGIIEGFIEVHHRGYRILAEATNSSKAAIVWMVGISGFILLNSQSFWEGVLGDKFFSDNGWNFLYIYVLPIITVIIGFLARNKMDDWIFDQGRYYNNIIAELSLDALQVSSGKDKDKEVAALVKIDTNSIEKLDDIRKAFESDGSAASEAIVAIIDLKRASILSLRDANKYEKWTTRLFFASFVWTFLAPFVFLLLFG